MEERNNGVMTMIKNSGNGCIKFNAILDCFITHHSIYAGISSIPYLYLLKIPSLSLLTHTQNEDKGVRK
jgi:hypothetical protein